MINNFLNTLILCCLPLIGLGQIKTIEFYGQVTETNDSTEQLSNVEIIVTKGTDTLQKVVTTSNGSYSLKLELSTDDQITLSAFHKFYSSQKVDFKMITNALIVRLDFNLYPRLINKFNSAIFENSGTTEFKEFDVELMKHQLRKLDKFCIEFSYFSVTDEDEEIVKKRISIFKEFLVGNGINITNFVFNPDLKKIECRYGDCRSRIEGAIISLEEKCN